MAQFQTEASSLFCGTPCVGSCGRIQASRLAAVSVVPSGIVRPIRPAEVTALGS